jgi:Flp pilus assembly protein TadG
MSRPRTLQRRLGSERGEGIVSALMLLAGVLIPLLFLLPLVGRLEQGRLAASQAARAAVRAAAESTSAGAAQTAAEQQLAAEQAQTRTPLQLQLSGSFERGGSLQATVTGQVAIGHLPLLGDFGTITVHASARAPVDQYRSLLAQGASP